MRRALGGLLLAGIGLAVLGAAGSGSEPGGSSRPEGTLYVVDRREDRVVVVDAATSGLRALRPPGLTKCGQGLHTTADRVVYIGYTRAASIAFALDPARPRRPKRLGGAHDLVPSRTPGRVWLAAIPRCRNVRSLRSVREVTMDGQVTSRSRGPVPGIDLIGAVEGGLVLQRNAGGLVAWNPSSGRILWRRRKAFALASAGRVVVWCPLRGCARGIHISDLQGGSRLVRPTSLSFANSFTGALAPDGSALAVPVETPSGAGRLALVDTGTGRVETVPRSRLSENFPVIAWSPDGWVFFNAGGGTIMAHRPGAEGTVELRARLPREILQLAAGG
jgi:hypothetical protein